MCDGGALRTDFRPDTIHSGLTGGIASLSRLVFAGDSGLCPPVWKYIHGQERVDLHETCVQSRDRRVCANTGEAEVGSSRKVQKVDDEDLRADAIRGFVMKRGFMMKSISRNTGVTDC
jgi:hypothetical protein